MYREEIVISVAITRRVNLEMELLKKNHKNPRDVGEKFFLRKIRGTKKNPSIKNDRLFISRYECTSHVQKTSPHVTQMGNLTPILLSSWDPKSSPPKKDTSPTNSTLSLVKCSNSNVRFPSLRIWRLVTYFLWKRLKIHLQIFMFRLFWTIYIFSKLVMLHDSRN